jgi:hypothetical protein
MRWSIAARPSSASGAGPPRSCWGGPAALNGNLHLDDQEAARNALARILRGESAVTHEYRIIRPDGSVRLIRDTCFLIRDDGGRLRRVAGIAQDITLEAEALVYVVGTGGAAPEPLSLLLRDAGYRVQEFATARAFMEMASVLAAGCVLLDVQTIEAADSVALLQAIAAPRDGLPVVVVGGGRGDVRRAVQLILGRPRRRLGTAAGGGRVRTGRSWGLGRPRPRCGTYTRADCADANARAGGAPGFALWRNQQRDR